jgi:hypothetical protein
MSSFLLENIRIVFRIVQNPNPSQSKKHSSAQVRQKDDKEVQSPKSQSPTGN